jgi:single-stranded DNA-binding protein
MLDASVSFAGNLTDQPELRHTEGEIARATRARSRPVGDRAARRNGSAGRGLPARWYYANALLTQRWR